MANFLSHVCIGVDRIRARSSFDIRHSIAVPESHLRAKRERKLLEWLSCRLQSRCPASNFMIFRTPTHIRNSADKAIWELGAHHRSACRLHHYISTSDGPRPFHGIKGSSLALGLTESLLCVEGCLVSTDSVASFAQDQSEVRRDGITPPRFGAMKLQCEL